MTFKPMTPLSSKPTDVRPVLQIGAIGHRSLAAVDIPELTAAANEVLRQIRDAARLATAAGAGVDLRCMSALAEGADLLFAHAALELEYTLSVALPFHREIYRNDFSNDDAKSDYDSMLGRATSVYELDGVSGDPFAYRAVGRVLVEQSDILLAIWDGQPERGPGGTADVIRNARNADVPVVTIAATAPYEVRIFASGGDKSADTIQALIHHLLVHLPKESAIPLQLYLNEDLQKTSHAPDLLRHLENGLLLMGGKSAATATKTSSPVEDASTTLDPALLSQIDQILGPHYAAADTLSIRYAKLYRTSALLRYLSVLPATIAAFFAFDGTPLESRLGFLAQLLVLGGTLLIYYFDERGQWHRRFLDYRFIAEHLRQSRLMALFGSTAALPRLPPHLAATASDWVNWRLHAVVRSLGLVTARVDATFLAGAREEARRELASQIDYYERRASRYAALSRILYRIGVVFFGAGLTFTVVREIMAVLGYAGGAYVVSAELALFIPAFAPVFLGIRSQNEYERLSQRYGSMAGEFRRIDQTLNDSAVSQNQTEDIARNIVSVMQGEISDWRVLIKARSIDPY